jgi:ectoine hydroxylase-related dioxygenase (phytanoyl-CoA dioxygenase family)
MSLNETQSAAVTEQLVQSYQETGLAVLRAVFSPAEIAAVAAEADRVLQLTSLIDSNNLRCRWQNHYQTDECRFDCFDPIIDLSPTIEAMARDRRVLGVVSALYGEDACLFKDKLIFKPPGARGYGLHQDYIGWESFPRSFVTVLIPIDPSTDVNGATEVFPGLHKKGFLSAMDGDYHELPLSTIEGVDGVRLCLEPGDLAVFDGMLPHRSAANQSGQWRRQLYLSYNARSDGGEQREAHYEEFHIWLKRKYAEYGKHGTYYA